LLSKYTDYFEYGPLGISVASMGTDLNSDFDEDEPYNREDDKTFLSEALKAISETEGLAGVMSDGGNAYTLKYVDHLLNVSLDSSRFMKASASIPFVGMVLHGYIQFAGTALNTEGDTDYAILKAIENGASLFFELSYRNTNKLKEDSMLSENYSVNYAIWKDDVIKYYTELNSVMKDLQTKRIINHEFIVGTRILDIDEIESNILEVMEGNKEYEEAYEEYARLENIKAIAAARAAAKSAVETMEKTVEELTETLNDLQTSLKKNKSGKNSYETKCTTCANALKNYEEKFKPMYEPKIEAAKKTLDDYEKQLAAAEEELAVLLKNEAGLDEVALKTQENTLNSKIKKLTKSVNEARTSYNSVSSTLRAYLKTYNTAYNNVKNAAVSSIQSAIDAVYACENVQKMYETACTAKDLLTADGAAPEVIEDAMNNVEAAQIYLQDIQDLADACNACIEEIYASVVSCVTKEVIDDEIDFHKDEEEEEEEDQTDSIYLSDNGKIVAVTYGGKDGVDNAPYKTFVLNYNNYAVTITREVNGEERLYTIPAGKYVVIMY